MKTELYLNIAIRIIGLFATGFFMSFLTPKMHAFFGDKPSFTCRECIDSGWEWSGSHYWFFWCMVFLFILSLINFIVWLVRAINKSYPSA